VEGLLRGARLRPSAALVVVVAVYLLSHAAQIAVTPFGEGMDFYGHLAYIVFLSDRGEAPEPGTLSVPSWILRLRQLVPGPDPSIDGDRYRVWMRLPAAERERRRAAALTVPATNDYVAANYESQQPPLYYWLMSRVYLRFDPESSLAVRVYLLSLFSECVAAAALVAIYLTFRLYLDEAASLLSLLIVAWYPNLMSFLGRITNDALAFPLMAWAVYGSCLAQRSGRRAPLILAGALIAVAGFVKAYALALVPAYLLCALWAGGKRNGRALGISAAIAAAGVGLLLWFNFRTTGHAIPLNEMRSTDALSLSERLGAVTKIDPVWFVGGLVKGFWWSGYWSFVSPGRFYFAPLLAFALLLVKPPVGRPDSGWWSAKLLWPHYGFVGFFGLAMLWHAAAFQLFRSPGVSHPRGNEGWYANVLLGCVATIFLVLAARRVSPARLRSLLALAVGFFIAWSLIARFALAAFWSGRVGRLHGLQWAQVLTKATLDRSSWGGWSALPGVLHPLLMASLLPLGMALVLSAGLVAALCRPGTRM
jgi:hypothetical protein